MIKYYCDINKNPWIEVAGDNFLYWYCEIDGKVYREIYKLITTEPVPSMTPEDFKDDGVIYYR
jgi:hypothetical protein